MDRTRVSLIMAPIIVSIICIVLAVNAGVANSQLNVEKLKIISLNVQIAELGGQLVDLERQLSDVKTGYDAEVRIVRDLQNSLDAARIDAENAKRELETLRVANSALETRLNATLNALQSPSKTATSTPSGE